MGEQHLRILDKAVLAACWAVTVAVGCTGLVAVWLSLGQPRIATNAGALFGILITCVYVIGYEAYAHQGDGESGRSGLHAWAYGRAIKQALSEESIVVILAFLMLDDGKFCLHVALLSLAAHWLAVCLIVVRRPTTPTAMDLLIVKYGFFLILIVYFTVGPIYWAKVGCW